MVKTNTSIKEIFAKSEKILKMQYKDIKQVHPKPSDYNGKTLEELLKLLSMDKVHLPLTPYAAGLVELEEEKMPIDSPVADGEIRIFDEIGDIIEKHYGKPELEYDRTQMFDTMKMLKVDNGRNLYKMGRERSPAEHSRRLENLDKYTKRTKVSDGTFDLDQRDLDRAVMLLEQLLTGKVQPDKDISSTKLRIPFTEHSSNVSGRGGRNESTVDKQQNKTYGQLAVEDSKEIITHKEDYYNIPATMYGRSQRSGPDVEKSIVDKKDFLNSLKSNGFKDSKARVVYGGSRSKVALGMRLIKPMIENVKINSLLFRGYNDRQMIVDCQNSMEKYAKDNKLSIENFDFDQFDTTNSPMLLLAAAEIFKKIIPEGGIQYGDDLVIDLIKERLLYWEDGKVKIATKFGTIGSGNVITNLLGGMANALAMVVTQVALDKSYSKKFLDLINKGIPPLMVMGDDVLIIHEEDQDITGHIKRTLDMDVSSVKGEVGAFFLQTRPYKDKGVSPSTRYISKLFWVENTKGLTPTMGTIATGMKFENFGYNPEFEDVVKGFSQFDKYKLGTQDGEGNKISLQQFQARLVEDTKEFGTMASKLGDGTPSEGYMFDKDGNVTSEGISDKGHTISKILGNQD